MQTERVADVAKFVITVTLIGNSIVVASAQDSPNLTTEDEQAYEQAQVSWKNIAEINEEVGLPPIGDEPRREDFAGYTDAQRAAAENEGKIRQEAEAQWRNRLEQVQPHLCALVRPDSQSSNDYRSQVAIREKEQLMRIADRRWAQRDDVEQELNAIAARLGVERKTEIGEGQYAVLAGELNGEPIWLGSQNQIAAASISADELWPTNTAPWPSSSTGLGLTGNNVLLGMWEVDGAVRETHYEFQGRVVQADNDTNFNYHATGVAGTMAAGGVLYFSSPAAGRLMRGVAYQADVDAYNIDDFQAETADAAAGTTNQAGLRLSNHSWGLVNGWRQQTFTYFDGQNYITVTNGWIWKGPLSLDYNEDPKFGIYLEDMSDGYGCAQLDSFLSTNATRHLLVYSAGNDRFDGPGSSPSAYYVIIGSSLYIFDNPGPNERDWTCGDGDTYAFDTMAAPGTAKNVLTVGSVQDVFHTVGTETNWGYATNSTVTLSTFSACGPTDDGRIKPDVVAVGEANPSARAFPIVTTDTENDMDAQGQIGTSFAAPGVTAGLALPFQRRSQLFTNLTSEADAFRGSTWKGLAIHTADDVGSVGPDYQTGWGLFNAASAVQQIDLDASDGRGTHIKELELTVGQTNWWLVTLDESNFKVTVVWSDPPGIPPTNTPIDPTTPMLVNNIDLWVETEDGSQTFLPWVLDPDLTNKTEAARASNATTGYDNRNNIEQIVINVPTSGTYRICVSHSGGTDSGLSPSTQWVSVLTSGDTPLPSKLAHLERSPSTNQFLIEFECDPGASLVLESSANIDNESSWIQEGTLVTESWTNAVLANPSGETRFWRLRRETGN